MKSTKYDSLPYVFACLSTHSKWVKEIHNDYSKLSTYFHLTASDQSLFQDFMIQHYKKLWAASILSEEKRWREALLTIPLTVKAFGSIVLKKYWENYLNLFSPLDNIPISPIYESIAFLDYLLSIPIDNFHKQVVLYEYTRNKTLTYEFNDMDQFENTHFINLKNDDTFLETCTVKINPSFSVIAFNISLSSMVNLGHTHGSHYFDIGFYKNCQSGVVKTFQVSETIHLALSMTNITTNALALIRQLSTSTNSSFSSSFHFLEKLHQERILFISILN